LESKVSLEILGDLTNKSLEGSLSDQKLSGLLVFADFSQGDGSWAVAMGLLDTSSSRGGFAGGLGGELLSGRFAASGLACGLLSAGHLFEVNVL
jgi:hypothetical protein